MSNVEWLKAAREAAGYPSVPFPVERDWERLPNDYSPAQYVSDEVAAKPWYTNEPDPAHYFRRICAMRAKGFWLPPSVVENPQRNPHGATGITGQGAFWDLGPNPSATLVVTYKEHIAVAQTAEGLFVLPGGMADFGEDRVQPEEAAETAAREAEEELGLRLPPRLLQALDFISAEHPWNTDTAYAVDAAFWLHTTDLFDTRPHLAPQAPQEIKSALWVAVSDVADFGLSEYHQELVAMATPHLRAAVTVIV